MAAEVHRCQFLARDGSACEKTSNGGWVVRDVGAAAAEFYACGAHWSQVGRLTTGASAAAKPTPAEAAERRRKFAASQGWDEACGWVTEPALPSSHRAAKRKRALPDVAGSLGESTNGLFADLFVENAQGGKGLDKDGK